MLIAKTILPVHAAEMRSACPAAVKILLMGAGGRKA